MNEQERAIVLKVFRAYGSKGGKVKTPARARASRENLKKAREKRWQHK